MKFGVLIFVFSTITAVAYGVLFSSVYPLVEIDAGIVALCAISGLATSLIISGLFNLIAKTWSRGHVLAKPTRKRSKARR